MAARLAQRPTLPPILPKSQPLVLPQHLASCCVLSLLPIQSNKWIDHSGNGIHGTNHGASPSAKGRHGFTWSFDGVDDHFNCGNSTVLNFSDYITIATWIYSYTQAQPRIIASKYNTNWSTIWNGWVLQQDSRWIYFYYSDGTYPRISITSSTQISSNTWYFVVIVISTYTGKLYLNGVLDKTESESKSINYSTASLKIAEYGNADFWGLIDTFLIFNEALDASDILALYNATKA